MNQSKIEKMAFIGIFISLFFVFGGTIIYMTWATAVVGKIMWMWFMVPTFGLPALTFGQAWGLSILVRFLTYVPTERKNEDDKTKNEKLLSLITVLLAPWISLLIAWICKTFFM